MTAVLVAGGVWGDEGKGSIVDALVRRVKSDIVVRYNGGHQAAHNVVTPEGLHHTFRQFGSGTLVPGVRTYLSKYVLVSPPDILKESQELNTECGIPDAMSRLFIDEECLIVTPFQRAVNRLLELSRGSDRHGSTGLGIGQTRADHIAHGDAVLKVKDLKNKNRTLEKLLFHRDIARKAIKELHVPASEAMYLEMMVVSQSDTVRWCVDKYNDFMYKAQVVDSMPICENPIFEGAQGALLDEDRGYLVPHVSWTNTSFENAQQIISDHGRSEPVHKVAVFRSYFTRHGAGPFPSETPEVKYFEPHNVTGDYSGGFRQGYFDTALARKGLSILGPVDSIAINHLDVDTGLRLFLRDAYMESNVFVEQVSDILGESVSIIGNGPTHIHKTFAPGYF